MVQGIMKRRKAILMTGFFSRIRLPLYTEREAGL
jgi:hypothetical protein